MKRYQVTELFQLAIKEYPELQDLYINIEESKEFSCIDEGFLTYTITYTNMINDKYKHKYYNDNICSYLQDKYKFKDSVKMIRGFAKVFSFLHEIGHIINMGSVENEQVYYNNFKNRIYNSYHEVFKAYREIPTESLADKTAIDLMIKYNCEIYSIMNEVTLSVAKSEIDFWNEF